MKLIVESPMRLEDYQAKESEGNLYITGPFMGAEDVNRNGRSYSLKGMVEAVDVYRNSKIKLGLATGELNHPQSPEINPERVTHRITELVQEGNVFYGKALVLDTTLGKEVKALLRGGVTLGVSSRALGEWDELSNGVKRVTKMNLCAIDIVSDPSFPKAYVNGIMESVEYIINESTGKYEIL
jgi:hypothetical protein